MEKLKFDEKLGAFSSESALSNMWSNCGTRTTNGRSATLFPHLFRVTRSQQVNRLLGKNRPDMFGELLQAANSTGDLRSCPVRYFYN